MDSKVFKGAGNTVTEAFDDITPPDRLDIKAKCKLVVKKDGKEFEKALTTFQAKKIFYNEIARHTLAKIYE